MIGVSMNNTDIIKDKINILDVVTPYVKLEKAGKTWKGKSPFNNKKHFRMKVFFLLCSCDKKVICNKVFPISVTTFII